MDFSALEILAEISYRVAMREQEMEKVEAGVFLCEEARRHYDEIMERKLKADINGTVRPRHVVVDQQGGRPEQMEEEEVVVAAQLWREKVRVMNGTAPELMLSKKITQTDLSHHHSRLLLSYREVERRLLGTLTSAELEVVNGEGLPITMLDKWGEEYCGATFKIWGSNSSPVIMGGVWLRIAERSLLEPNDYVDLFAFCIPPSPPTESPEEEGGDDPRGKNNNKRKLVLVVSSRLTSEEEERRRKEEPSARVERLARARPPVKESRRQQQINRTSKKSRNL